MANQNTLSDQQNADLAHHLLRKREAVAHIQRKLAALDPKRNIVERRSNLSRAEFLEQYYAANRPVILCGLMKSWAAMTRWTPDYFKSVCGEEMVEIMAGRESNPTYEMNYEAHRRSLRFSEYVDMVTSAEESNDFYLVARSNFFRQPGFRPLLEDFSMFPEYLQVNPNGDGALFWYGPKGTLTPLHHDGLNILLAQIQGRKQVKLISPDQLDLVYNHMGVYSQIDCNNPDYERFPKFREANVIDVELAAGEVLFLPVGWWHYVKALDRSISISFTNSVFPNQFEWVNPPHYKPAAAYSGPTLDDSWTGWVLENLERKCDPGGILEILLKHGFPVEAIRHAMGDRFPYASPLLKNIPAIPGQTISGVSYKDIARIPAERLMRLPGSHKVDTPKLQLITLDHFLTDEECDELTQIIDGNLRPSTITIYKEGFRTSRTSDLSLLQYPIISAIDRKIALALGIQLSYSEGIQAQKYRVGEEFKEHTDFFTPNTEEYEKHAAERGNRTWTFMVYLDDTPKGGGTRFVNIDRIFYPKKGTAVIWNSLRDNGMPNHDTLHCGLPVEEGEKTVITKWFRENGTGPMFYGEEDYR